jgi:DNA-binding transcriptional LysR family regulator
MVIVGADHADQRYPRLTVKLEVCNRFAVQQKILSGQADLAVMGGG